MPHDGYWAVAAIEGWILALIALVYVRALAKENAQLRKRLDRPHSQDVTGPDPYVAKHLSPSRQFGKKEP